MFTFVQSSQVMHDIMVKSLPAGCRLTAIFDVREPSFHFSSVSRPQSCHSGSALDLPYIVRPVPQSDMGAYSDGNSTPLREKSRSPTLQQRRVRVYCLLLALTLEETWAECSNQLWV